MELSHQRSVDWGRSGRLTYHCLMDKPYVIQADWDPSAGVWVASSDDVPGLVTEAETLELLDAKLKVMVPELLQANHCLPSQASIQIEVLAKRLSTASTALS